MSILAGGLRIILGIALIAAAIFCLYVKIGNIGGFLCGIVLIILGNLKGFETVASFLGLESGQFQLLFMFCLIGSGLVPFLGGQAISNILGGIGMFLLGIFTTGLLTGEQAQPAFNVLAKGFSVLALPLFLIAVVIVLFARW